MNTSEHINEIATALAKAQGEFPQIPKGKKATVRGVSKSGKEYEMTYKYADIADVLSAIAPVLSANDICYTQPTVMLDTGMFIETRLVHAKSGQWMSSLYPVCGIQGDHQKMGGSLTYARRYALCSILGVAAEEDLDAQHAEEAPAPPKRKAAPPPPVNPQLPSSAEVMELMAIGDEKARDGLVALQTWWKSLTNPERQALGDKQKDEWKLMAERREQGMAA